MHLANAVNDAFARWDRAHLSMFTLAGGRVVTDTCEFLADQGIRVG
ncbi:hypothetical protein R1X32_10840 (plasmid) [Rhodococcus opacus]